MLTMMLTVLAIYLSTLLEMGDCQLLVSALRQKRDKLSVRGHHMNHTVMIKQQPIVFNHVYNINVPMDSLCSVRLDSSSEQTESMQDEDVSQDSEQNLDSQVAFTHNIHIPKQMCDCPHFNLLRSALERLKMLEREVSILRQQCSTRCLGQGSASGRIDYAPMCNGHGNFSMETCDCSCELGWTGKGCSVQCCQSNCSGHGLCVNGQCLCDQGYTGQDCSELQCPGNCSGHGLCVEAECVCETPYTGEDCGQLRCLNNCSQNGQCNQGTCFCQEGYTGQDCGQVFPPQRLRVTSVTDRSIALEWERSVIITEYLITYTPNIVDGLQSELRVTGDWTAANITGLEPGIEYSIQVYAVLNNQLSVPINSRITTHLPTPQGLRFKSISETAVEVQWEPFQFTFDGWEISFIAKSNEGGMVLQLPSTVTAYNQSGLRPGEEYTVNVVAIKEHSRSSPATAMVSTLIDGPNKIIVREVADTVAFVEWTPPRAHVDYVLLSYGLTSGASEKTVLKLQPSLSQFSLQNLRPASQYEVSVTGIHDGGQSQTVTTAFTTELDAPRNLRVVSPGDSRLEVEWDNSQADVDKYRVVYSTLAGGQYHELIVPKNIGPTSKVTLTDLLPGTEYGIGISAIKETKQSVPATMNARTELDRPLGFTVAASSNSSISLVWTQIRGPVDHYQVSYSTATGVNSQVTVPKGNTTVTLNNLEPHTKYNLSIVAVRGWQQSYPSITEGMTGYYPVQELLFSEITENSVNVSWQQPTSATDVFILNYNPRSHGETKQLIVNGRETHTTLSNLQPGVDYLVTLLAVQGTVTAEPVLGSFTTALDPPRNVTFTNVSEDSVTVVWSRPVAAFDHYQMLYQPAAVLQGSAESVVIESYLTEYTLTDLQPATEYKVNLNTVRGLAESRFISNTVQTAMDKPLGVRVLNMTPTEAVLEWIAPQATVENYVIFLTQNQLVANTVHADGEMTRYQLSGLQPFTNYSVTIYAVRDFLTSVSASTNFLTPLDPPRNLTVSEVTRRSALISWLPPVADIENYVLVYKDHSGQQKELILDADDTWIRLEGLSETTEYSLGLQSAYGTMRSTTEHASFTTAGRLYPHPWDCTQHLLNGDTISGIYTIYLNGEPQQSMQVYCDMTTDGGGWLVLQRRQNGLTDFARKWADYRVGFGNLEDEFWLGLDNIHKISAQTRYELRIDLRDGRESVYATYDRFYLSDARNLYKLRIGDYNGTAGDSLSYHQGRPFSTKDRDNDVAITNCALSYKGAWWYKNCHRANLNGKYGENRHSQGINWFSWRGHELSIPFVEMKVRPSDFKAMMWRGSRSLPLQ
ncbi:tenascin-R [Rhincodon typus]|uniref:tenascin-R n=1 Tax=Rhincodon typus TaxID=259920 RepID=UPI002030F3DA|nr:tenascin-R [Rhincodon typus]